MEIKTNLNSRQFRLYDYLKSRGNQWTTQFQIVSDLTELYGYADKEHFHDSANRHQLTNDIRMINESDYIPKPILSSGRGVKIANEKEFDLFIALDSGDIDRIGPAIKYFEN